MNRPRYVPTPARLAHVAAAFEHSARRLAPETLPPFVDLGWTSRRALVGVGAVVLLVGEQLGLQRLMAQGRVG